VGLICFDMTIDEEPLTFDCEGETLIAVLSGVSSPARRGVLVVVGGPQYRVGSHRQFTLLARYLAGRGLPVMRFDYRGMGDSGGETRTFERVGTDIRRAIDRFLERVPQLTDVVIWGLCDAASAALFYAHQDRRVSGLALVNPWVRTEQGAARAYLRHYYAARIFNPAFWRKISRGEFGLRQSVAGLGRLVVNAMGRGQAPDAGTAPAAGTDADAGAADRAPLPERMEDGLRRFRGPVLLVLSGSDLTAQEFKDLVAGSRGWTRLLASRRVTRHDLPGANHTFARREWRDQLARWTEEWVKSW